MCEIWRGARALLRPVSLRRMLKTIERALAGQSLAVRPHHRAQLARQHRKRRILAQLVVIVEVLVAQNQPKTRCARSVSTRCSTYRGSRRSVKHWANRPISRRPRSTCPNSNTLAFEVIAPPSNPAITERPSTASNENSFGVHSACIGVHLSPRQLLLHNTSQILSPDALPRLRNPG
jgi:hypothetical protein